MLSVRFQEPGKIGWCFRQIQQESYWILFFSCNFTTIDGQRCSEMWDDHQRCFVFCYSVQMMPRCGFNGCRDANLHSFCSLLSDPFLTVVTFQISTEVEPLIIGLDSGPKELQLRILPDGWRHSNSSFLPDLLTNGLFQAGEGDRFKTIHVRGSRPG